MPALRDMPCLASPSQPAAVPRRVAATKRFRENSIAGTRQKIAEPQGEMGVGLTFPALCLLAGGAHAAAASASESPPSEVRRQTLSE